MSDYPAYLTTPCFHDLCKEEFRREVGPDGRVSLFFHQRPGDSWRLFGTYSSGELADKAIDQYYERYA